MHIWSSATGDFVGSHYEDLEIKGRELPFLKDDSRITDDTILIAATADAILNGIDFPQSYKKWYLKYPDAGYGPGFSQWANSNQKGFSFGNGAGVRSSIIGLAFNNEDKVLEVAAESASCSHAHKEGIAGAQASALSVYHARIGTSFEELRDLLMCKFDYLLYYDYDSLNQDYGFESSAENTIPVAIFIGYNSNSLKECLENCLYVGGDTDTIMAIAMLICSLRVNDSIEEFFLFDKCRHFVSENHPDVLAVLDQFSDKFPCSV